MKKIISLIAVISILASMFVCMPVANAFNYDNDNAPQLVDQNSAYVVFGSTNQTSGLTVSGSTTQVTYDGVTGAQLAENQTLTLSLGSGKTASKYVVVVKFYDPGVNVEDFTIAGRTIRKTGMQAKWVTESFVLESSATSFTVSGSNALVLSKIEFVKYSGTAGASDISVTKSNGSGYSYIKSDNPLIRPYVTAQGWNYQGTKFIFKTLKSSQYSLYEYDIVNGTVTKLDTGISGDEDLLSAQVTYDNKIYYTKADGTTWKIDWLTYKAEQVANAKSYYSPSVTNDGEWMTGVLKNWGNENRQLLLQNTKTGEAKSVSIATIRNSWSSGSYASHPLVNPEYPHLVSVAHDNDDSSVVHSRIWLSNFNSDTTYNMFTQIPESDTVTGEKSGHEIWGANGENMYWVKFNSSSVGQTGIMRTDKYGATREYINGDYAYWHCFPSMDDNWVVADANPSGDTDSVVLVNTNSYKSTVVASFTNYGTQHPNQPHPHISGNNYAVSWQFASAKSGWINDKDNNKNTSIGWAVVRDTTKAAAPTNRYSAGTGVELITCNDGANASSDYTSNGITYKYAVNGKGLYFDISSDVVNSTNATVTLEISYLDKGSNPLVIKYTNGVDEIGDLAVREDATYNITKSNTSALKTATVTLENANLNNAGKFRSDFYISSTDGAYISGINAVSATPGSAVYNNTISSYPVEFGAEHSDGLEIRGTSSAYNAILWHVNNKEGWTSDGISQDAVDKAKNNGCNYVAKNKDGAWSYRKVSDKDGVEKTVYFTSKNNRADKGWIVSGSLYFNVKGDVITEADNNVTFDITYLDFAKDTSIKVEYTASDAASASFTIPGTGTGKWKTASVTVNNAKMSSTNSGTPFALNTEDIKVSYNGDMYIASVSVSKQQPAPDYNLYLQNMYYNSKDVVVKPGERVTASADNNVTSAGMVATGLENNANYDSTLYHVDDTAAWTAAGFSQSDITTAKNAGCNYVTLNKDGAWMYKEFTDKQGVTKNTFYAPNNWRKSNGTAELSNIYFRLTNDTIAHSDAGIVIAIEYLDNGGTLDVTYVSRTGLNTVKVVGTHTGKWKTSYIAIDDAAISANNSDTALALGSEDIKIATDQVPVASVTVMKQYGGAVGESYEVLGGNICKPSIKAGDIATPNAVVTNKSGSNVKANLYTIVYNADKTMKSIQKGNVVTVNAGATAELSTPEVTLLSGETIESFVWDSTLTPVEKSADPLGIVITPADNSVKLTWNNGLYAGHFINIYSRGKLVGRTNGSYCILDNLNKGNNTLIVDVVDTYGKVVLRSKSIIANVK